MIQATGHSAHEKRMLKLAAVGRGGCSGSSGGGGSGGGGGKEDFGSILGHRSLSRITLAIATAAAATAAAVRG